MSELILKNQKQVPKGWGILDFPDVVFFQEGPGLRSFQFTDNGMKVVNVTNIVGGLLDLSNTSKHISIDEFTKKYPHFAVEDKDILMASSGATYGKTAFATTTDLPLMMNTSVIRLHPKYNIYLDRQFLNYFLQTGFFKTQIRKFVTGSAQPNFGPTHLTKTKIFLAPLNEQKQISVKIDELFSKLNNIKNLQKKIQIQLRQYRQSLLKSAFEGTLSVKWREENKDKIHPIVVNNVEGKKHNSLFGWTLFSIGDITKPSKEKFNPKKEKNEIFIGLANIEKNTGKIIGNGNSDETLSLKTIFKKGDVLYGRLRPYLNKVCVPDFDGVCSTDILVFSKNSNFLNKFFAYYFLENNFVKFANKNMSGVQHPRITFDKISDFPISLPSLNEQKEIVLQIENGLSLIDNVENISTTIFLKLEVLYSGIIKQAFEGKLVPQDPNDKSVEILLQKIKQEKEQLIQKQKASRSTKNVK